MGRTAEAISRWQVPILLVTSPLFLFARPSLTPALVLLPLLWLARRRARGHLLPRTALDWPILGLLVMVLVSTLVTPDLPFSLGKIVGVLYGVALFYAVADLGRHPAGMLVPAVAVAALGAGAAFLSLLGTAFAVKWTPLQPLLSALPQVIQGVPLEGNEAGFNPNQVSGALLMFLPLQLTLLAGLARDVALPRGRRMALLAALALSLAVSAAVIFLAQSRAAWVSLAAGLLVLAAIAARGLRPVLILLLAAGFVALVLWGPVDLGRWLVEQGLMVRSGETSWTARVELWSRGLWGIADYPLTGMGMNMFRRTVWELYPLFEFTPGYDVGHAHNLYLQAALDLGLPGLVCYLALMGGGLALGWQAYRRAPERLARLVGLGAAAGLAVHAMWGLTDVVALGAKQGFLWWAVLALVTTIRQPRGYAYNAGVAVAAGEGPAGK
jgi:putative inorganic carbon (hco3(-)) transporter